MSKGALWAGAALSALLAVGVSWLRRAPPPKPAAAPAIFEDVSSRAGIDFRHFQGRRSSLLPEDMGSGACWGDVDGDGNLDLYLLNAAPLDPKKAESGSRPRNALYRSRGDGTFEDVTEKASVHGRGLGMGCVFGDFNNSGRHDLFVTGYGGNIFYRNDGGWKFTEITRESGLSDTRWATGACLGDYDNDGRLDIYVPHYIRFEDRPGGRLRSSAVERGGFSIPTTLSPFAYPPESGALYHNEGAARFRNVTSEAGVANGEGKGMQCLFADLDEDGRPDLYVADDVSPDILYRNTDGRRFADVTSSAWLGDVKSSMGIALGDFDRDGDQDLAVTEWIAHEKSLYINLLRERRDKDIPGRRLHFADGNAAAGLGEATLDYVGWGVGFLDYDNDGLLDLLIVNGSTFEDRDHPERLVPQRMQLFHNNGNGTFSDVSASAGPAFQTPLNARGAAFADYDRDGRVDVAINVNGGRALLLRNLVPNGNHWLEVGLAATRGNWDSVGARVTAAMSDGRSQTCLVTAGGSYLSGNSLLCHFGLGSWESVDRLDVVWPSGRKRSLKAVAADRVVTVNEP
ncbi:MAG TPA: hypothetical protein DCZ01_05700 [Elusimicrobia bacterium]|nr:MAG: hypothetical protein A2X37_11325 [Elusimicrobia bacterium GWA2_66_18]HAZ08014.1 hypothetical protein [Elusimicrobiota bacterium]